MLLGARAHLADVLTGMAETHRAIFIPRVKAIRLNSFDSKPLWEEIPSLPLPADSLRLQVLASPINPADLNVIEGKYGRLPQLPATLGLEGVGRVSEVGSAVTNFTVGDLVLPTTGSLWAEQAVLPAGRAVKILGNPDPLQAAMLKVNPPTAYGMLTHFARLEPGDWIVQNAANSGVGRCVIQIARLMGVRTLNVCRRPELIDELTQLGGDLCVLEDSDLPAHGIEAKLAFNSVGGTSALNLMNILAPGGTHITYGAMARTGLKIPNGPLIFKDLRFRGFWVTRWLEALPYPELQQLVNQLAQWIEAGKLVQPIDTVFRPEQIDEALARAAQEKRSGKVLLKFAD